MSSMYHQPFPSEIIDPPAYDSLVRTGITIGPARPVDDAPHSLPPLSKDEIASILCDPDVADGRDVDGRYTLNQEEVDSLLGFSDDDEPLQAGETPAAWTFKDEAVAEKFDDHVRSQLPWYDALSRYCADIAVSFLPHGGVLYDIGASTGNMTRLLADDMASKGAHAFSIEPSHQMAGRFTGVGDLWAVGAEHIDYEACRPDVAVLFLTMMFMPPATRTGFLNKLFDAVKPGGAVILVDKGYLRNGQVQVACKAAQLAGKRRAGTPGDAYVIKELSLRGEQRPTDDEGILSLALEAGFVGEEIFRFGEFYGLLLVKASL